MILRIHAGPLPWRGSAGRVSNTHEVRQVRGGAGQVVEVLLADVPLLDDQVDGHLPLQTADVPVTEVITELMDLPNRTIHNTFHQIKNLK